MLMKNLGFLGFSSYFATSSGEIYSLWSNRFVKTTIDSEGFPFHTFSSEGSRKSLRLNLVVALCFVEGYKDGMVVSNIDGNKLNNDFSNLEWVNSTENCIRADDIVFKSADSNYTDLQIDHLCKLLESGLRNKDISNMTGVDTKTISDIRVGKIYDNISSEYNIGFVPVKDRISVEKITWICKLLKDKPNQISLIAKTVGVNPHVVVNVKKRQMYTVISKNYHW
jgi:hypothetical protein